MTRIVALDWTWFETACQELVIKIATSRTKFANVYGVPRGGLVLAVRLSHLLDLPLIQDRRQIGPRSLVCDDICDSGGTLKDLYSVLSQFEPPQCATLVWTKWSDFSQNLSVLEKQEGEWIRFPWESSKDTVSKVTPQ